MARKKIMPNIVPISETFRNFAFDQCSLNKRFGRLLNNDASEPGGAEAIVFLGGIWMFCGRIQQ